MSKGLSVRLLFLSALLILALGACGGSGGMDAMSAMPDLADGVVAGQIEDADEAAIVEAAKRNVEEAVAQLEAALTYLTQLLGDQAHQQPAPEAVEYNPALQAPVISGSYTLFTGGTHYYWHQVGIQGPHILGHRLEEFDWLSERDGVLVSYGTLEEGLSRLDVIAYLLTFESPSYPGVSTFAQAPVIRLAEGTGSEFMDYTLRAVQQINAVLPAAARLHISDTLAPAHSDAVPNGEIFVDFTEAKADWPNDPSQLGTTTGDPHARPKKSAHVWLNVESIREAAAQLAVFKPQVTYERAVLNIVTHELLHAIGFDGGHANYDLHPNSIMHTSPLPTFFGTKCGGNHLLCLIDSEALAVAYGALSPGDSALSLSTWSNESVRIHGDIPIRGGSRSGPWLPGTSVNFGTASRNGLSQPWAIGPTPETVLAANPFLQGSATWNGHLLGFTPDVEGL